MRVHLGRLEELFDDHMIFSGVTYTDAHVTLTGMLVVCAALVLGAVIAAVNAVRVPHGAGLPLRFSRLRYFIFPLSSRLIYQQLSRETERTGS
jgi:Uncharacterised protein family (UPF0182).